MAYCGLFPTLRIPSLSEEPLQFKVRRENKLRAQVKVERARRNFATHAVDGKARWKGQPRVVRMFRIPVGRVLPGHPNPKRASELPRRACRALTRN